MWVAGRARTHLKKFSFKRERETYEKVLMMVKHQGSIHERVVYTGKGLIK